MLAPMAGLGETLSRKRRGGSGLLLLALLLVLLIVPLWRHRAVNHPLAGKDHLDACLLLAPLPPMLASFKARAGVDTCELLDPDGVVVLSVGFTSNRSIAGGSNHGTSDAYAIWVKEVRASGATEMQEHAGPWKSATSYRLGTSQQLLIEDGGLLIILSSPRIQLVNLMDYGRDLAPELRKH
jgi:hypothetical protein